MIHAIKKELNKKLSKHIMQCEIDCHCDYMDCTHTLYSPALLKQFETLRSSCGGKPLKINSGFRCQRHNSVVGGTLSSKHKLGLAIDISKPDFMKEEEFLYRASQIFDTVVDYKTFIHCHLRISKI